MPEGQPMPEGRPDVVPARTSGGRRPVRVVLGEEHEVWRVEASRGRAFGSGVYDLCREESPTGSGVGGWRLLAVAD